MDLTVPPASTLAFYVANNLRFQQMDEKFTVERRLTLPQAIALYNSHRLDQVSAIGATVDDGMDTDIVQRREGMNLLISDYQKMNFWKYNPELSISAVNMLIISLGIRNQRDAGALTRPLEERLHIMQLKDGTATRDLRWESLAAVERMGRTVDMRNYNLIYSDAMRDDESFGQLYQRLNTQAHPEGYRGHSLSMSDVVILQGRKGCTAYYVDRFGFAPLSKFVRPPGGLPEAPQRGNHAEKEGR
mgnify:CR=1 FL=1